ncbi:DUF4760 domain-containing protein [Nitrosomonas sp.]|uniref:DUF4760 domain-containing protein n=1 Tax=Nitrosomonas sp. TaxID=42353 RepID=UPI0025F0A339|nr:DUF4760 domain-containing protein [Nitrosomonas sp.]MBY0483231.1 DUF4760 domain-containing protein [Nitrosomonas sp.]
MEIEFKKILDDGDVKNKEIYEKIVSNRELNTAIRTSLSTLETIAVAIQEDCVSEEFMYLSTHSLTLYMEAKYKAYINAVRGDYNDPQIFIELEKLATAWRSRTYLSTGEKIL